MPLFLSRKLSQINKFKRDENVLSFVIYLKFNYSLSFLIYYFSFAHRHNSVFKDVYREVGMLEVFVTCLTRYHELLKGRTEVDEEKKGLSLILLMHVTLLLMYYFIAIYGSCVEVLP